MEQQNTITDAFEVSNPYLKKMHAEADTMQAFLVEPARLQDPTSLTVRLKDMDVYMARLSEMISRAKAMKERALNLFLTENEAKLAKLTATASNRLINTHLYEYVVTYNRLDTMYHTAEHLSRDLVTQISYIKQQMATGLYD